MPEGSNLGGSGLRWAKLPRSIAVRYVWDQKTTCELDYIPVG